VKKILYFIAPLLFACVFLSCEMIDEKDEPPPKTLDQWLVGGRWYLTKVREFEKPDDNNGYLEFFADNKMSYIRKNHTFDKTDIPVYSENGVIYNKENDNYILEYGFYKTFPYRDITVINFYYLDQLAAGNNLIVCPNAEVFVNDIFSGVSSNYKWQFLIRFHDDGTPYR